MIALKPDLVGISTVTQYYNQSVRQARELRERIGARVIIGGAHINCAPETLDPAFDLGVMGEGEYTLAELVGLFDRGQWSPEHWQNVNGIVFRNGDDNDDGDGGVTVTPPREIPNSMDDLPPPDLELLGDQWNLP